MNPDGADAPRADDRSIGGVVFRVGRDLKWLPATVAAKIMPLPTIARVPGAPESLVGVALVDGETIPVVALGAGRGAMVVCVHGGERLALVGLEVVAAGKFEPNEERAVICDGMTARLLDLAPIVSGMRTGGWAV